MSNKRVFTLIITVLFVIGIILCFVSLFKIRQVNVEFSVVYETDEDKMQEIQSDLNKALGKSWVFYKNENILKAAKPYTAFYVQSIKKQFPNKINVVMKERNKIFEFVVGDTYYVSDEHGFIISSSKETKTEFVQANGFTDEALTVGAYFSSKDFDFSVVSGIVAVAGYSDNVKSITIREYDNEYDLFLETNTGVTAKVLNIGLKGVEKMERLWAEFEGATDYVKSYDSLEVFNNPDGEIMPPVWTKKAA